MRAYQLEHTFSSTHKASIEIPPDAPEGQAKIIVLFPDKQPTTTVVKPRFANLAAFKCVAHDAAPLVTFESTL